MTQAIGIRGTGAGSHLACGDLEDYVIGRAATSQIGDPGSGARDASLANGPAPTPLEDEGQGDPTND